MFSEDALRVRQGTVTPSVSAISLQTRSSSAASFLGGMARKSKHNQHETATAHYEF
jgi:hypothetical protein